jgi:hypothetical protein
MGNLLRNESNGGVELPVSSRLCAGNTQPNAWEVTDTFACSLLLPPEVHVSGARTGNLEIKQQIDCITATLNSPIPDTDMERSAWPLLIVRFNAREKNRKSPRTQSSVGGSLSISGMSRIRQCNEKIVEREERTRISQSFYQLQR